MNPVLGPLSSLALLLTICYEWLCKKREKKWAFQVDCHQDDIIRSKEMPPWL